MSDEERTERKRLRRERREADPAYREHRELLRVRKRIRDSTPEKRAKKRAHAGNRRAAMRSIISALRELGWLRGYEIVGLPTFGENDADNSH